MIPVVPAEVPVATPEDAPIVATVEVPLVHVPPGTEFINVVVPPAHTVVVPVIGATG